MSKGDVETYHENGMWHNRVEGESEGSLGAHDMKDEAVSAGRLLAQVRMVEHIVKNHDGSVGERHSYGRDRHHVSG